VPSVTRTSRAIVAALALTVPAGSCSRTESPQTQSAVAPPVGGEVKNDHFQIAIDTGGPMKIGAAPLDVTVTEDGKPASGVDVSVELRMPPSGAMGEMRTGAQLQPAGAGHYRGQVEMTMPGQWNAIVRIKRGSQVVATHTEPVTAQ